MKAHDSSGGVQTSDQAAQDEVPSSTEMKALPPGAIQKADPVKLATPAVVEPNTNPTPVPEEGVPLVTPLHLLGDHASPIDCPFCNRRTMTNVIKTESIATVLTGALCCLLCICLTPIPCMLGWFEDVDHYCTGCGQKVTTRPYDGPVVVLQPTGNEVVRSQHANSITTPSNATAKPPRFDRVFHRNKKTYQDAQIGST
ncbi:MAG: hypothetical protein M1820_009975 [Bogoriella megaspora]|nr:MAG: hypothetical protein M1820_009975 [Bogoriella megaspora]